MGQRGFQAKVVGGAARIAGQNSGLGNSRVTRIWLAAAAINSEGPVEISAMNRDYILSLPYLPWVPLSDGEKKG